MSERELLFRVTKAEFEETHIRGSGPGGQHRNKSHTGVRLRHRPSGAVGEATDSRSQHINRANAFRRLRETREWQWWFREAVAEAMGRPSLSSVVDNYMRPENITTQVLVGGQWKTVKIEELAS